MIAPISISVVNFSTIYKDADLPALCNALQIHFDRDFGPIWNVKVKIYYTPAGAHPTPAHWVLGLFDDADMANALGYHDLGTAGQPLGKIFVRTTLADGQKVEVTTCHEADEMVVDAFVDKIVQVDNLLYAYESDDAVENDEYDIAIPAGWAGAGTSVPMSNFVTDAWFHPTAPPPYDFLGKLTAPLTLSPGGYIGYLDLNNMSQGWQQKDAKELIANPAARVKARARLGSRRNLRKIPRGDRVWSTCAPGTDAIPADGGPLTHAPQLAQENSMKKIDRLKVTVTVPDFVHVPTAEQGIAAMNLSVGYLDVELTVGNALTPTPEQLKAIQDATVALAKSNAELETSVEAHKP